MECPHCGKEMRKGRLSGGRDYVYWKDAGPDAELVRLTRFGEETQAFYCPECRKVTLDVPEIKPWTDLLAETVDDVIDAVSTVYEEGKNLLEKGKEEREEKKKRENDPWEW